VRIFGFRARGTVNFGDERERERERAQAVGVHAIQQ
jgi:hypothetical protein